MNTKDSELPKISIITVSYNSAETRIDTFDSIRSQTYKNIEYIVVEMEKFGRFDCRNYKV